MVFEGIVISKVPYKERDLIVKLLLRSGLMASYYIYGGQGGGKHYKPSQFELGSMMKIQIKERRMKNTEGSELMTAAEYQRIWEPQKIRHEIRGFYLACLFSEIIQKFALTFHPDHEGHAHDHEGIFNVMSNALFYLDDSLIKDKFVPEQQLSLFMVKLLHHLGIMPETDNCGLCGNDLLKIGATFLISEGQFACLQCVAAEDHKGLLIRLKTGNATRYAEYENLKGTSFQEADKLIQFFCHHFHLKPFELKSYSLLFK